MYFFIHVICISVYLKTEFVRLRLMVQTWTHVIDMDSWYWQRLMICTWTYGIDNTHGIVLNSWYSIRTSESHTYERAECCPYAGLFGTKMVFFLVETESYVAICLCFYRFLSPFWVHLLKSPCWWGVYYQPGWSWVTIISFSSIHVLRTRPVLY